MDACGTQGDWDRDRDDAPTARLQDPGGLGWRCVPVSDGLNQPTSQNVESLRGESLPAAQTPARGQKPCRTEEPISQLLLWRRRREPQRESNRGSSRRDIPRPITDLNQQHQQFNGRSPDFITLRLHDGQFPLKLKILKESCSVISLTITDQISNPFLPPLLNFTTISIICFVEKG